MDNGSNSILPAGLSLNSAVSIIPTSPHKVPSNVPNKVSNSVSNMASKHVPPRVPTQVNYIVFTIYSKYYLKNNFSFDKIGINVNKQTR